MSSAWFLLSHSRDFTRIMNTGSLFFIFALWLSVASAMPRYLIIPIENVHFMPAQTSHHRTARAAWPQGDS